MNTTENASNVATSTELPQKVTRDGMEFELNTFDGKAKGFGFYVLQFAKLSDAQAKFGDDVACALINRQLNFAMRQKANNSLPKEDDARAKLIAKGETLLISADEAAAYVPGERDVTSVGGLTKRIGELKDEIAEARKSGDVDKAESLKEIAKGLVAKLQAQIYAGLDE